MKGSVKKRGKQKKTKRQSQDLTSNPLAVPDGFEGKDTALERYQNGILRCSDILLKYTLFFLFSSPPVLPSSRFLLLLFVYFKMKGKRPR